MTIESETVVAHLVASFIVGGPEQQLLGLARHLPPAYRTVFLSFAERGLARAFLDHASSSGFEAIELRENWPHVLRAVREVAEHLRRIDANVLCTSGYKPDLIGWLAARRVGIPVIAIAHGWTAATWKVRLNETLDRLVMRYVDCVVGVSQVQSQRVRQAGVRPDRIVTIQNSISLDTFAKHDLAGRKTLESFFDEAPRLIVLAAGRLSPEKGFDVLIDAATKLIDKHGDVGFLLFGDGPLRDTLNDKIVAANLQRTFVLGGFRRDMNRLLPHADVLVLSSHTEGLPVILLEALAAGVPVVATSVGGVPELIEEGVQGFLVPPRDVESLTERLERIVTNPGLRQSMAAEGPIRIQTAFSCTLQSQRYQHLFERLGTQRAKPREWNSKPLPIECQGDYQH